MATNPAVADDVEVRWRALTDAERVQAQVLLIDAWALATKRVPTLPDAMDADEISSDVVVPILANMVIRRMQNPDGILQETVDDYTYRRDSATSRGALYLSDEELADLGFLGSRRALTMRLRGFNDA